MSSPEKRHDLFAFDHIQEALLDLRADRVEQARPNLKPAQLQYMLGTRNPELEAFLVSAEARIWWARGHRSTAIATHRRAVKALERGGLALEERRAEVFAERALYYAIDGDLGRARDNLDDALEILDGVENASPRLWFTILHNLAAATAGLSLAQPEGEPGKALEMAEARAYLDGAADLYEPYGTPCLRAQREVLRAATAGEPCRFPPDLFQPLFGFDRSEDSIEAARVALGLLEWLEMHGRRRRAAELMEDLRDRLASSTKLTNYFAFFSERLSELAQLAELTPRTAELVRFRLELLERLTTSSDSSETTP